MRGATTTRLLPKALHWFTYCPSAATCQSGYGAVCKTVYPGSIPGVASNKINSLNRRRRSVTAFPAKIDRANRHLQPPGQTRLRLRSSPSFRPLAWVICALVVNSHSRRSPFPDCEVITAPCQSGIDGHFAPQLRRFVLAQYHAAQTRPTMPRPVKLWRSGRGSASDKGVAGNVLEQAEVPLLA
jgi:hypothetical protein